MLTSQVLLKAEKLHHAVLGQRVGVWVNLSWVTGACEHTTVVLSVTIDTIGVNLQE